MKADLRETMGDGVVGFELAAAGAVPLVVSAMEALEVLVARDGTLGCSHKCPFDVLLAS